MTTSIQTPILTPVPAAEAPAPAAKTGFAKKFLLGLLILAVLFLVTYTMAWYNADQLATRFFQDSEASYKTGDYLKALVGYQKFDNPTNKYINYGGYLNVEKIWSSYYSWPQPPYLQQARQRAQEIINHVTAVAAESGIHFRMDRALRANTLLAHRLLWLAEASGHQLALKERLLQAYFCDGLDVGDTDVLAQCAAEVGMPADGVRRFLDSDDGTSEVQAQLRLAADAEISAVPTYVIDGRWAVPGAQDPDTFVTVVRRLLDRRAAESSDA